MLYAIQCLLALRLRLAPEEGTAVRGLSVILIALFVVGIVRAWTLPGDPQRGWSGWLNPLQDLVASSESDVPRDASR